LQRELDKACREAKQQRRRAEQATGQAEQERRARLAAEREVARLRNRLAEHEGRPTPEE
jgi:hypothetical protein